MGSGEVIIRMTQPQYDSRVITPIENDRFYSLSFRDENARKTINLELTSKIAITGPDGTIKRIVTISEARKEAELAQALSMGAPTKPQDDMVVEWPTAPSLPHALQKTKQAAHS